MLRNSSQTELKKKEWSLTDRKFNKWKMRDITLIVLNYQDKNKIDK